MSILNNLGMWIYFSSVHFKKSKYRSSISNEILAPKLRYVISEKYTLDFKDLV